MLGGVPSGHMYINRIGLVSEGGTWVGQRVDFGYVNKLSLVVRNSTNSTSVMIELHVVVVVATEKNRPAGVRCAR